MYLKTTKKIHVGYLDKKKWVTCFLEFKWVRSINKVTELFNWYVNKYGPVKHILFLLKRSIIKNDIYLKIAAYLDMLQISHQPVENGLCKPIFEGCRITQAEELREKIRS